MVIVVLAGHMKKTALLIFSLLGLAICNATDVSANAGAGAAAAGAAAAAAAAATAANTALYFSRSQREENQSVLRVVNHMSGIDLSNRRICVVNQNSYLDVNNCRKGDIILINQGTLHQMMEVCKPDDPIIAYKGSFACTYEDHEKLFYTPKKHKTELPRIVIKE